MNIRIDLSDLARCQPVIHKEGVMTVDGFFSREQCRDLIEYSEANGFEPATVRMSEGAKMRTDIRNNDRFVFDDFELAGDLWPAAELFLDAFELDGEPVALNERMRFYRYDQSQRFKRHRDGREEIRGLISQVTFMVYLNDDYSGGETVFSEYSYEDGRRNEDVVEISPKSGTALFFLHHLWHEGSYVETGRKYVLRTDVLCRPGLETTPPSTHR